MVVMQDFEVIPNKCNINRICTLATSSQQNKITVTGLEIFAVGE
jgi:hypothetical protein